MPILPRASVISLTLVLPVFNVRPSVAHSCIIQRNTNRAPVVPVVLPYDTLTAQLPQPCIVVATSRNQVGAIRTKCAVPDPSLVSMQRRLKWKRRRIALGGCGQGVARLDVVWGGEIDGPDAAGVVGGAGCEVAHIGGQQDAGDVGVVGEKLAHGYYRCKVAAHDHFPDVDVALAKMVSVPTLPIPLLLLLEERRLTALLPAHTILPSLATVTLATDTSSSGISW